MFLGIFWLLKYIFVDLCAMFSPNCLRSMLQLFSYHLWEFIVFLIISHSCNKTLQTCYNMILILTVKQWIISVCSLLATMRKLLLLVCLYIFCLFGSLSSRLDKEEDFLLLAGPLTKQVIGSSGEGAKDVFDCSHPVPSASKQYFQYLQSRGVTHFKVPLSWAQLLPTGLSSQPQQAVVRCYQTLLKELHEVGLKPVVILHGSVVPESLRSRYGGWESQELGEMFQQYAQFAFQEFGTLVHSWVTLSKLEDVWVDGQPAGSNSSLQNILQLNKNIYQFYHQHFPEKGK